MRRSRARRRNGARLTKAATFSRSGRPCKCSRDSFLGPRSAAPRSTGTGPGPRVRGRRCHGSGPDVAVRAGARKGVCARADRACRTRAVHPSTNRDLVDEAVAGFTEADFGWSPRHAQSRINGENWMPRPAGLTHEAAPRRQAVQTACSPAEIRDGFVTGTAVGTRPRPRETALSWPRCRSADDPAASAPRHERRSRATSGYRPSRQQADHQRALLGRFPGLAQPGRDGPTIRWVQPHDPAPGLGQAVLGHGEVALAAGVGGRGAHVQGEPEFGIELGEQVPRRCPLVRPGRHTRRRRKQLPTVNMTDYVRDGTARQLDVGSGVEVAEREFAPPGRHHCDPWSGERDLKCAECFSEWWAETHPPAPDGQAVAA